MDTGWTGISESMQPPWLPPCNFITMADMHDVKRQIRKLVSKVLNNGGISGAIHCTPNTKSSIAICGLSDRFVRSVADSVKQLLTLWGDTPHIHTHGQTFPENTKQDIFTEDFHRAKHVIIVASADSCNDPKELSKLLFAYRLAKGKQANVLVLLVRDVSRHTSLSDFTNGIQNDSTLIQKMAEDFPEFRILHNHMRVHFLLGDDNGVAMETTSHVLHDWLLGTLPDDGNAMTYLDFNDACKIFHREMQEYVPELRVLARILVMCAAGTIAVLFTLLIIILLSKEISLTTDIRKARQHLKVHLEQSRSGRSEWGGGHDSSVLIALQLNDPSWCLSSEHNQRSVDRLEISLLSDLSSLRSHHKRELTASKLSFYILALLATYQNPKDFHDFNLITVLQRFLAAHLPYEEHNNYSLGHCVAALCNAGVTLNEDYLEKILQRQSPDGSLPLGIDETAMTVLALSCFDNSDAAKYAMIKAVNHLRSLRNGDGSYGNSVYSTALVVQALNVSGTYLPMRQRSITMSWIVEQSWNGQVEKDILVASQVLITLAGKSIMSVRETTGYLQKLSSTELILQTPSVGKYSDAFKHMKSDRMEDSTYGKRPVLKAIASKRALKPRSERSLRRDFLSVVIGHK
ncbi:hypothetical protein CAPTEDRAFT_220765 [Capitella teleta]|uniref:Uncharacterized protein n=1 Tax=Capitella teleta TaxID=283909 RepID=R7U6D5_CAPTE|nr:hypothetical protein CAPTEDRAFT_220765 [Capitella teleta]|eukprot:ELU01910.1 hypothetical protein CAPTEDRAFT_220765 [Capitella teleta]